MTRIPGTTFHDSDPPPPFAPTLDEAKILAKAVCEIGEVLSGYLGDHAADPAVYRAAHLAYSLHNDALAILENRHFDVEKATERTQHLQCRFVHTHGMLCRYGSVKGSQERCTLKADHEGPHQFPGGPCSQDD